MDQYVLSSQVIGMSPSMDDRHILAEMERHLSRDDPELVERMDALNHQFPDDENDSGTRNDEQQRYDWRWKAIVVFAIVLAAGLILTAIFSRTPSTDDKHAPPYGRAPAVSVHTPGPGLLAAAPDSTGHHLQKQLLHA
ncbi:DUF3040 domain-containing protein [Streptomyces cupreus]|uniref:DUF3040 domain-containing protein n=1 Tax=Streptomyces cupreus TaxID=2759956 RepID=A0A7X1J8P1_9ACTN|nr:DUF3040 domain-containing protein [Streptomyces cupreus]MBC2906166.1 DUF3040 domain-containing protein [Streptomyces cupreus]